MVHGDEHAEKAQRNGHAENRERATPLIAGDVFDSKREESEQALLLFCQVSLGSSECAGDIRRMPLFGQRINLRIGETRGSRKVGAAGEAAPVLLLAVRLASEGTTLV